VEPVDAIIAGVNKAGTTSLYVSMAEHPNIVPSAIKETRYFLPARYGRALRPVAVWDDYFAAADRPVRLEATPSYFYGGSAVAHAIRSTLANPRVIIVLREPVSRAVSFFEYQKVRLRLPRDLTIEDYLAHADALTDRDFDDAQNERFMAVRGGRYADWLQDWFDVLGTDAVKVVYFEDLIEDGLSVLAEVVEWLGLDPTPLESSGLRSENRTTSFKNARLQQMALGFNDGAERLLRRLPSVKRAMRSAYFALNGRAVDGSQVSESVLADLAERYVGPNARLGTMLDANGVARPSWLPAE
jgi:hypothetical protein